MKIIITSQTQSSGNNTAVALCVIGWITIVLGVICGLFFASSSFVICITVIISSAVSGILFLGFAEIISLLQFLVNKQRYEAEIPDSCISTAGIVNGDVPFVQKQVESTADNHVPSDKEKQEDAIVRTKTEMKNDDNMVVCPKCGKKQSRNPYGCIFCHTHFE